MVTILLYYYGNRTGGQWLRNKRILFPGIFYSSVIPAMYRKRSGELEKEIESFITGRNQFDFHTLISFLEKKDYTVPPEGMAQIKILLSHSPYLLNNPEADIYVTRAAFFKNFSFIITPSLFEIETGIIIPGHRFLIFLNPRILPWHITVFNGQGAPVGFKTIKSSLPEILTYYTFFEHRKLFSLLAADNPANKSIFTGEGYYSVQISALDMKDFYVHHAFKEGDSIQLTIEDWDTGRYTCTFLSRKEMKTRKKEDRNREVHRLDRTLIQDFERYGPLPAGDQLSHAYFSLRETAGKDPYISPGTYLAATKKILLTDYFGQKCFWYSDKDPEISPRGSSGAFQSLNAILEDTNCLLRERDMRLYFLDEHARKNGSLQHALNRICPEGDTVFGSDLQRKIFYRYCSKLWDETGKNTTDKIPAKEISLRRQALKLMDRHLALSRKVKENTVSRGKAYQAFKHLLPLYSDLSRFAASAAVFEPARTFLKHVEENTRSLEETFFGTGREPEHTCTLKIILKETKPPVWRRIKIQEFCSLEDLHNAVQIVMGWDSMHLHGFTIDKKHYGPVLNSMQESSGDTNNERKFTIKDVVNTGTKKFTYTYDFNKNWVHLIRIEGRELREEFPMEREDIIVCLGGRRACPPPRCSGPAGYTQLLEDIAQGNNPLQFSRYNPAAFDKEAVNRVLREVFTSF